MQKLGHGMKDTAIYNVQLLLAAFFDMVNI
jgi:hypothetical protein